MKMPNAKHSNTAACDSVERRNSDRRPLCINVLVYLDDQNDGVFATTVDWSDEGARILFTTEFDVPDQFIFRKVKQFAMSNVIHCKRVWQTGTEVGVAFIDPAKAAD